MNIHMQALLSEALCNDSGLVGIKHRQNALRARYSHCDVRSLLERVLPTWRFYLPSELGEPLSTWPAPLDAPNVLAWLNKYNCPAPKHLLGGICEMLAVYLSNQVVDFSSSENLADQIHAAAFASLKRCSKDTAAAKIFTALRETARKGGLPLWNLSDGPLAKYLLGGDKIAGAIAKAAAKALKSGNIEMIPLYILGYIYSEVELTQTQLETEDTNEAACYSCHVVGLVFHPTDRVVIVADPNGGMIPNGNMELVRVPLEKRTSPNSSTVKSQFQIDQIDEDKKSSKRKRRKL
jgi:hypothetical protein